MKFYKFEVHEYMDMKPTIIVKAMESVEVARAYAKHMNENYSGGRTTYIGEMTDSGAKEYIFNILLKSVRDYDKYKNNVHCLYHITKEELADDVIRAFTLYDKCYL